MALPPGPRGPDYWWLENLDLSKRASRGSVVDPPDGRIPSLTPEAQQRAAPVRSASSFVGGPFNGPEGLRPARALHQRAASPAR